MAKLIEGDLAPDFEIRDQFGQLTSLSSQRGVNAVLLVFFPFAFTPTCTGELEVIERERAFRSERLLTWGVSCDPVASLKAFAESAGFTTPLLSDFWPHGAVSRSYGVFLEDRGFADRGSFLIDRDGVLRWVLRTSPSEARDAEAYRQAIVEFL